MKTWLDVVWFLFILYLGSYILFRVVMWTSEKVMGYKDEWDRQTKKEELSKQGRKLNK